MEEGKSAIRVKACGAEEIFTDFRETGMPAKASWRRIVETYQKWGEQQDGRSFPQQFCSINNQPCRALALCGHGTDDVVRLALGPNSAQLLKRSKCRSNPGQLIYFDDDLVRRNDNVFVLFECEQNHPDISTLSVFTPSR